MTSGGRNLTILGVSAVIIAVATCSVSLIAYHNSGDIYLDRSRPGFLPDEDEILDEEEKEEEKYEFNSSNGVTKETLEEYIEKLETEIKTLETYSDAFSSDALSDEKLGISDEM